MKLNGITESAALLWLEKLMAFCQTDGRACYGCYSPEVLRDYLTFHIQQETLAWVRNGAAEISGCGIAWQCHAEDVIRAAVEGRSLFDWQANDPFGNAIFIADVVAVNREASLALLQRFARRFPTWREMHLYTFRRGKLVRLDARAVIRFFQQQNFNQKA